MFRAVRGERRSNLRDNLDNDAGWGTTEATADIGATVAPFITPATLAFQLPLSSQTVNGFLGGGQIGWNWQTGVFVFGVEGDVEWENLKGSGPCLLVLQCNTNHKWQADITGRVGVAAFDRALVYIRVARFGSILIIRLATR